MFRSLIRRIDDVVVVDLGGRITLGEANLQLRQLLHELIGKGERAVLLNLAEVTYIDSSGLGELVVGFTSMRSAGGELKLLNLTRKVHDLLQITKLYTVFDVQDDEATAIARFTKPAKA